MENGPSQLASLFRKCNDGEGQFDFIEGGHFESSFDLKSPNRSQQRYAQDRAVDPTQIKLRPALETRSMGDSSSLSTGAQFTLTEIFASTELGLSHIELGALNKVRLRDS